MRKLPAEFEAGMAQGAAIVNRLNAGERDEPATGGRRLSNVELIEARVRRHMTRLEFCSFLNLDLLELVAMEEGREPVPDTVLTRLELMDLDRSSWPR